MKEHRLELADIFRTHQEDFRARWNSVIAVPRFSSEAKLSGDVDRARGRRHRSAREHGLPTEAVVYEAAHPASHGDPARTGPLVRSAGTTPDFDGHSGLLGRPSVGAEKGPVWATLVLLSAC